MRSSSKRAIGCSAGSSRVIASEEALRSKFLLEFLEQLPVELQHGDTGRALAVHGDA
jgi:hypothetical protein